MTDITYDPEADAVYIAVGRGKVDRTEETGPFIYDIDAEGHIIGIEILCASKVLAPGDWKKPAHRAKRASVPPNSGYDSTPLRRIASRHEHLRRQGLRPVLHWVPDLRDPKVLAEIRREVELMAKHPENDAIDDWIESVYDWESWK